MVASTSCSPPSTMDDITATPTAKVRPTQSYYVPRPILEHQEREKSPKEQKRALPSTQLYTPPHSRGERREEKSQKSSSPKLRPLMDIQLEKSPVSLFACSSDGGSMTSSSSASSPTNKRSPEVHRKSENNNNKKNNNKQNASSEPRREMFPKIISVPSSSKAPRNVDSPPRESFSSNLVPPPAVQPAAVAKDGCICDREKTHIGCKRCGFECLGRLVIVCPLHPMQMNLMDLSVCPNPICHSVQLFEITPKH